MLIVVWSHCQIDQKQCSNNENHIQIMEFSCCLNMIFTWKSSKRVDVCLHGGCLFAWRQNVAARNEHFVCDFVDVNVVSGNDVFDVRFCKPTPFCKRDSTYEIRLCSWLSGVFGAVFDWNKVKSKNNDYTCLWPRVEITFSGPRKCSCMKKHIWSRSQISASFLTMSIVEMLRLPSLFHLLKLQITCINIRSELERFSSPEPSGSQGELIVYPYSGVRVSSLLSSSSSTMFKHLLLWNRFANQSQILCGASLGRGNESLYKWSRSHDQDGRHAHIW